MMSTTAVRSSGAALTDEQALTALMRLHGFELQIGGGYSVWRVRVRGYDPNGALHEDPFTVPGQLCAACVSAIRLFCVRYGIPENG